LFISPLPIYYRPKAQKQSTFKNQKGGLKKKFQATFLFFGNTIFTDKANP